MVRRFAWKAMLMSTFNHQYSVSMQWINKIDKLCVIIFKNGEGKAHIRYFLFRLQAKIERKTDAIFSISFTL